MQSLEDIEKKQWDDDSVLEIFKELKFSRFIERFGLSGESKNADVDIQYEEAKTEEDIARMKGEVNKSKILYYYLGTNGNVGAAWYAARLRRRATCHAAPTDMRIFK